MDAAQAVAHSARMLREDARTVLFVHRGAHGLWDEVARLLAQLFPRVLRSVLPERDDTWDPGAAMRAQRGPGVDLLVYQDPFGVSAMNPRWCEEVRELVRAGTSVLFIDFPHALGRPDLLERTRRHYVRALACSPQDLHQQALGVQKALDGLVGLRLQSADGSTLTVRGPWQVNSDWTAAESVAPIVQLPAGELWLTFEPDQAAGRVRVAAGAARPDAVLDVAGGVAVLDGRAVDEPLIELGIGVNRHAAWLPGTALAEKAWGRTHFGFGDSTLLGGTRSGSTHFDVPAARDTVAWGVSADGSVSRLDQLLA